MKKSKWLILLLACLFFNQDLSAQNSSNKGKEFWVGFMAHYSSRAGMYLYITADSATTGVVSIPGKNWSKTFSVAANSMTLVQVPSSLAYVGCSDCITKQGIKVTAQKKVIVYSHIYYQYRSDATLVLPVQTTGKEYYCMAYEQGGTSHRSQFMVVAKADSTRVKITPTVDLRSSSNGRLKAGKSYYVMLHAGEVYQGRAYSGNKADDITGTHIEVIDTGANAKCRTVSVFSGNSWTTLGCTGGFKSGDNLYEQMYPVNSWGQNFVTVPLRGVNSDNIRVMASRDNTNVLVYNNGSGATTFKLDSGEYDDLKNVNEPKYILASAPICVAQYSKTQSCAGGRSDPAMTIINPIQQTLSDITLYSSKFEDIDDHYINIVIPTQAASSFRLDGKSVTFTRLTIAPNYSYAREKVAQGNHRLTANQGFLATAYGFGRYESYGYAAGANVRDLTAQIELSNSTIKEGLNVCVGQEAEFKGSAEYKVSRYEWFFGDGIKDTVQNPNHAYKDTGTYQVKLYTYKSSFDGCSNYDSAFLTITVTGNPTAKYVTTPACEKGNVTFIDSSQAPDNEKLNYAQWYFGSGSEIYAKNTTRYFDSAGKYFVRLIVRTENYCFDTIQDSLNINHRPEAKFTAGESCQLDSTSFTNLSTIAKGAIDSFVWDFGTGDSSYVFEPKYLFPDSGHHEVILKVISDSLCESTFIDTIYKYQNVNFGFTFNDTCQGIQFDFVNTTNTSGANVTGSGWVTSLGDSSSNTNFSHTFDSAGTFDVYYWVEIDSFCKDSLVQTIEVYPLAKPAFTNSNPCTTDSVEFIDKTTISSGTSSVVSWDVDDGLGSTLPQFKVLYSSPGTKDITLNVTTDKGCASQLKDQITIGEIDITDIDVKDNCPDVDQIVKAIYTLSNDSVVVTGWDYGTNIIFNDTTPQIRFTTPGTIDIKVEITTKNGCKTDFTKTVNVHTNPTADFTIDSVCDEKDFTFTNNSIMPDNRSKGTYQWYYGGSMVSANLLPSIASDYNVSQMIRLIVTSEFGCKDTLDKTTEVYPNPVANFNSTDTCFGATTIFTSTSTISNGNISNYVWKFHDASQQTGNSSSMAYGAEGNYDVNLVLESDKGCFDSITKAVGIHPLPVIDIAVADYDGCEPFTPIFTNNSSIGSGSIINYDWVFGDGQTGVGFEPNHSYPTQGSYQIRVIGTSDKGCVDSIDLPSPINVHTLPTADFSFSPEKPSILESDVTFTDKSSLDAVEWSWDFDDGSGSDEQNPMHTFSDTGTFNVTLTVRTQYGCESSTTQSFSLSPDLFIYIPDGFSPNGDLINDGFGVAGVKEGIKNFEVTIYNRWGEKIYYSDDHNAEWDGTYQSKPVPPGSYVYEMRFTDYKESRWYFKKGELLLLR